MQNEMNFSLIAVGICMKSYDPDPIFENEKNSRFFFTVLMLDGNFEIGAHVRSNLCNLICLKRLLL